MAVESMISRVTEFATSATRNATKRAVESWTRFPRVQLDCEALLADSRGVLECVGRPTATAEGTAAQRAAATGVRRLPQRKAEIVRGPSTSSG